jgi:hypothetical protein
MATSGLVSALTDIEYYTALPHAFGSDHAATLRIVPCAANSETFGPKEEQMFTARLKNTLRTKSICFNIQALEFWDQFSTPIEDATTTWEEGLIRNKYTTIATLNIPRQEISINDEFCRRTTFNPFNQIDKHQPLGGIHRVRGFVYQQAQALRQQLVGDPVAERTWEQVLASKGARRQAEVELNQADYEQVDYDEADYDESESESELDEASEYDDAESEGELDEADINDEE